jgi:hypothetical protein
MLTINRKIYRSHTYLCKIFFLICQLWVYEFGINNLGLVWSCDPESYAGCSLLPEGSPMPDRSRVMAQTTKDTLVLQVGWGLGEGLTTPPCKIYTSFEPSKEASERKDDLEALFKGVQGSTSGCCAIEEE